MGRMEKLRIEQLQSAMKERCPWTSYCQLEHQGIEKQLIVRK
jgi:hypothetical protein